MRQNAVTVNTTTPLLRWKVTRHGILLKGLSKRDMIQHEALPETIQQLRQYVINAIDISE